jgi:ATP-dependent exoDNAse (exonuclease V) beta subunit
MISLTEILRYRISAGDVNEKDLHSALSAHLSETPENLIGISIPWQKLLNLPLYEMAEELIRLFKLERSYDPYLQFFLDAIISYTNSINGPLSDFLEWWQENKAKLSIVVAEGQEAVRIMTIHKSKGLEFPVVLYPFADEKFSDSLKKRIWVDLDHEELPALRASLVDTGQKLQGTIFEKEYMEEVEQAELDAINLLYVAMTRPVDRLYLMSRLPSPPKDGNDKNIAQLFVSFLKNLDCWHDDKYSYEFGRDDVYPVQEPDNPIGSLELENMVSVPWRDRLLLSTNAPKVWNLESPGKRRDWGNLVHHLLAKVNYEDGFESVIELARVQGLIDASAASTITDLIRTLIRHPLLAPYYSGEWRVRNEVEIFDRGKAYRPDRLAFRDRDVVVIDYKTGHEEAKHADQLDLYARKLTQMSYNVSGKYLVYIGEAIKVIEV